MEESKQGSWFAVRTVYLFGTKPDGRNLYEERIVAFAAGDLEQARGKAAREAEAYAAKLQVQGYSQQVVYEQEGRPLLDGYELWSEIYESELDLDTFYHERYERFLGHQEAPPAATPQPTADQGVYDLPLEVLEQDHSETFELFLHHFFFDPSAVARKELDLGFLQELEGEEKALAQDLVRRNLATRHTHLVEATALLHDQQAVPELRQLLANEKSLSRRLAISGALWHLAEDPVFFACLQEMQASDREILKEAHMYQVTWLNDERALDLLIGFLEDESETIRHLALSRLNTIEFRKLFLCKPHKLPHLAESYQSRRQDPDFRQAMVTNLREWYNQPGNSP